MVQDRMCVITSGLALHRQPVLLCKSLIILHKFTLGTFQLQSRLTVNV